jgi:YVTN family beta-propeller protein
MKRILLFTSTLLLALPLAASTARIYVTNSAGTEVHVIDPTTNKVVQVIEGIEIPHGVNFSPDGSRVYISNESENVLNVVDQKTGKTIKKVPLSGHPNNIAVTKDGGKVFICIVEKPGALDVVDTKKLTRSNTIPMAGPMHNPYITPDGKYIVAGSQVGKFIVAVNTQTEKVEWQLDMGSGVRPMTIEAAPDGSTSRVFAELSDLNGFAIVDFKEHKLVGNVEIPKDLTKFPTANPGTPSHGI